MTTLERAESCSAHTLAHAHARTHAGVPSATSHSVLDVATKNKRLGAEDALQRRGRSGSRTPDGAAKLPRPSGDLGPAHAREQTLSVEQRETEQRVESNLILRALGCRQTEVSLSLSPCPHAQLSAAFACRLSLSLFLFSSNKCLSLSLSAFPSVCSATCLVACTQQVANFSFAHGLRGCAPANATRNDRRKRRGETRVFL